MLDLNENIKNNFYIGLCKNGNDVLKEMFILPLIYSCPEEYTKLFPQILEFYYRETI